MHVDGKARQKRYALLGGETIEFTTLAEPEREPVPPAQFEIAYEDDRLIVVNKPAGVVVHPGVGNRDGTLVQALAGRVAGGNDPDRPGRRAPAGPRHLGPAPARPRRADDVRPAGSAAPARHHPRVRRARRGPPARQARHDRRAARPRPPGAYQDEHRHRRSARGDHALRDGAHVRRTTRCCGSPWRPGARTRSARICWRSDIPSRATRSTATRAGTGFPGSSCTRNDSRSITPRPGHPWSCGRHCRRTWSGPSGRRQGNEQTHRCRGTEPARHKP